jgi:hypothetical protein
MGRSPSDFKLYDRPLVEYGVDGPTLSVICKSDHGVTQDCAIKLRVCEIFGLEKNYISDVWIEQR